MTTTTTTTTTETDPEVAAAALELKDAVESVLRSIASMSLARRRVLKSRDELKALYADGLPNPTLVDIVRRVKTSTDDRGITADFKHIAASLGGLLKSAAAASASAASASIVGGGGSVMGRLGSLINKVAAAPKPSDRDVTVVFLVGELSLIELTAVRAESKPRVGEDDISFVSASRRRHKDFILGAERVARFAPRGVPSPCSPARGRHDDV